MPSVILMQYFLQWTDFFLLCKDLVGLKSSSKISSMLYRNMLLSKHVLAWGIMIAAVDSSSRCKQVLSRRQKRSFRKGQPRWYKRPLILLIELCKSSPCFQLLENHSGLQRLCAQTCKNSLPDCFTFSPQAHVYAPHNGKNHIFALSNQQ